MSCCYSVTKSCPTLCDAMDCSTPGSSVLHYRLRFAQIHVHWVGCYLSIFSSASHFSCPQSFPASGSFPIFQLFTSGSQSIGVSASASVLPADIQGWFPLELTGLISLQSKGLSRVLSSTIQRHQFFGAQLLYIPTLTSIHDYQKNHSFNYTDLGQQSDVFAF